MEGIKCNESRQDQKEKAFTHSHFIIHPTLVGKLSLGVLLIVVVVVLVYLLVWRIPLPTGGEAYSTCLNLLLDLS